MSTQAKASFTTEVVDTYDLCIFSHVSPGNVFVAGLNRIDFAKKKHFVIIIGKIQVFVDKSMKSRF